MSELTDLVIQIKADNEASWIRFLEECPEFRAARTCSVESVKDIFSGAFMDGFNKGIEFMHKVKQVKK